MDLKYLQRNFNYLKQSYNTWGMLYLQKTETVCVKPLISRYRSHTRIATADMTPKGCRSFAGMVHFFKHVLPGIYKNY